MIRKLLLTFAVVAGSLAFSPVASVAQACPMCKLANEEGTDAQTAATANARPKAYMYSILFMLSMPATVLGAFSLSFYRIHRRHQAELAAAGEFETAESLLAEPTPA
jgi:hypothetical protein